MSLSRQPRRPSLPTVVGSGLAIVAAGSLLAFSSLAEQAGLQGLSTGGLRPADPQRLHGTRAITIPAPATAPPEPGGTVDELVRRVVDRDEPAPTAPPAIALSPRAPGPKARRIDDGARVKTVAGPAVPGRDDRTGPPYGHAYGYHKERGERPEPATRSKKEGKSKQSRDPAPVHARTAHGKPKSPKPPKPKKVEKTRGGEKSKGRGNGHSKHADAGKGKGHSKHSDGRGNGNGHSKHADPGKGKGHSKHGHGRGKGKGKGHSKHGH